MVIMMTQKIGTLLLLSLIFSCTSYCMEKSVSACYATANRQAMFLIGIENISKNITGINREHRAFKKPTKQLKIVYTHETTCNGLSSKTFLRQGTYATGTHDWFVTEPYRLYNLAGQCDDPFCGYTEVQIDSYAPASCYLDTDTIFYKEIKNKKESLVNKKNIEKYFSQPVENLDLSESIIREFYKHIEKTFNDWMELEKKRSTDTSQLSFNTQNPEYKNWFLCPHDPFLTHIAKYYVLTKNLLPFIQYFENLKTEYSHIVDQYSQTHSAGKKYRSFCSCFKITSIVTGLSSLLAATSYYIKRGPKWFKNMAYITAAVSLLCFILHRIFHNKHLIYEQKAEHKKQEAYQHPFYKQYKNNCNPQSLKDAYWQMHNSTPAFNNNSLTNILNTIDTIFSKNDETTWEQKDKEPMDTENVASADTTTDFYKFYEQYVSRNKKDPFLMKADPRFTFVSQTDTAGDSIVYISSLPTDPETDDDTT